MTRNPKQGIGLLMVLMLSACTDQPSSDPPTSVPPPVDLPKLGIALNLCCNYVILHERPEKGQLISKEVSGNDHLRTQDVYLRIVDRDGRLYDQEFVLPAVEADEYYWINFTYPDAPPPLVVAATSGRPTLMLANPTVPHERGNREFVTKDRITVTGSFPPTHASAKLTGPFNASTPFPLDPSVIQWVGFPQNENSSLRGTAGLRTAAGRDIWVLTGNGFPPVEGTLSEGSRPLSPGEWVVWVNGTGRLPIDFDVYRITQQGWDHYGIKRPSGPQ